MVNWLLIGLAGAAGALMRYGIGQGVERAVPEQHFPWATFVVNMAGCVFFGFVYYWIDFNETMTPETQQRLRLVLLTGFAGAFTTYSTYAFQTTMLIDEGKWGYALANIGVQTIGGLIAIYLGAALGKILV